MREITITRREEGQRLDKFLAKYLPLAPAGFIYKMLRKKNITLNKKKAKGDERVAQGDVISLFLAEDTIASFLGEGVGDREKKNAGTLPEGRLDILYEDDDIILINKPAGLLSQKSRPEDVSLVEYLHGYLLRSGAMTPEDFRMFKPALCNRLDRNTSGLVIAGKTIKGLQDMGERLKDRSMDKYYLCLVKGRIQKPLHLKGFLKKDEKRNQAEVSQSNNGGSPIETFYTPLDTNGRVTLLSVKLITGKSHQIRAHLAFTGHPIVGDYKYGESKLNEEFLKKYHVKGQLLHAYSVTFEDKTITAPLPPCFVRTLWGEGLKVKAAQGE